jgi:hypothetical protein
MLPADLAAFWNKYLAVELLTSLPDYMGGILLWGCEHAVTSNRALHQAYGDGTVLDSDLFVGEFRGVSTYLVYGGLVSGDDTLTVANFGDPRDEWYRTGERLSEFVEHYVMAGGDEWWS